MANVKERLDRIWGGWIPDLPDPRDYSLLDCPNQLRDALLGQRSLDLKTDLRYFLPVVEDQRLSLSTTAFACGSLLEYFNRRCYGKVSTVSKSFLYDVARRMHCINGDSGISIRQVFQAVVQVGVPPHRLTQSCGSNENALHDPFLYSYAHEYEDLCYYRVAPSSQGEPLQLVKTLLHLGIPCVFGMPLYGSVFLNSMIDYRPHLDEVLGGASGVFVGYDDAIRISSRGALLFRSSWGESWGESGHGWISYDFLREGVIRDIWTVFKASWIGKGDFPFG